MKSPFAVSDSGRLRKFVSANPFAVVITAGDGSPRISQLPVMWEADDSSVLTGHFARTNLHWQSADGDEAVVLFRGPDCYVSPAYYEEPNTVPTWLYVSAKARGRLQIIGDPQEAREVLRRQSVFHESDRDDPWDMSQNDAGFTDRLAAGVVAFRIEVTSLEGTWKLNQHHSAVRRRRTIEALHRKGDADSVRIAELMAASLSGSNDSR